MLFRIAKNEADEFNEKRMKQEFPFTVIYLFRK